MKQNQRNHLLQIIGENNDKCLHGDWQNLVFNDETNVRHRIALTHRAPLILGPVLLH